VTQSRLQRIHTLGCLILAALAATGCQKKAAAPAGGPQMQALPVQTITVTMAPVAQSSEYVATIKSRRSATMQPQVSGSLTVVHVRSAATAGRGRFAARHRAPEEGSLRLRHHRGRPPEQAV
jgi:hypothetical protein